MKKRFFSLIMMLFLAVSICLTGCGKEGLKNNPKVDATVFSNGGMTVVKGDYLYFVNGYIAQGSLKDGDNKEGKVVKSGIYRTKIVNNEIVKDEEGFLATDPECVVSKVVGFDKGGFYIIDNYLYYVTPHMLVDRDANLQNYRLEFHRINIDGTNDETLYVTSSNEESAITDWALYKIGNTTYLVVYESDKIISINALTGETVGSAEVSMQPPMLKENDYVYAEAKTNYNQTHIVYTRAINTEKDNVSFTGQAICSFDIATGKSETLELNPNRTYTIKHVTRDTVYYTYKTTAETIECLYKKVLTTSWNEASEIKLTNTSYDSYYFLDYGNDIIIASGNSSMWRLEGGANNPPKKLISSARDIVGIYGDQAYYVSDGKLVRFSIIDGNNSDAYSSGATTLINNNYFIDFDNTRVYVYTQYTAENGDQNYYLNYFNNVFAEGEFEQRFVGLFESDDVPAKPEQPESEDGEEVEKIPHID